MINRKSDCENEVSSQKLAVLKITIFWKSVLLRKHATALKKVRVFKK